jgi:DNA-directed RNA polymerase specialized sigma24 family protein
MEELVKYMRALVALQLRSEREEGVPAAKPELVLAGLGFTSREIADLTGKSHAAVAKTITRAKATLKAAVAVDQKEVSDGQ